MVAVDAASEDQHLTASANAGAALSLGHFAHELDSLLDGSLRCVELASHLLEQFDDDGAALAGESIWAKLRTAQDAMMPVSRLFHR